jgi:cbb3-type cytochrome oxidase subunit 3
MIANYPKSYKNRVALFWSEKKEEFQEQNRGLLLTVDDGERVWEKRC